MNNKIEKLIYNENYHECKEFRWGRQSLFMRLTDGKCIGSETIYPNS